MTTASHLTARDAPRYHVPSRGPAVPWVGLAHWGELPTREQKILLMDFRGVMTQAQIGQWLRISQMHVSRLRTHALGYLRRPGPLLRPGDPPGQGQRAWAVSAARRRPLGRRHRPGCAGPALGRLAPVPPRSDGVLVPPGHRLAALDAIPVAVRADEPLLLAEEVRAPEFNQFTVEMCRAAGFTPPCARAPWKASARSPTWWPRGHCLYCVPSSCISALPGTTWRPLTEPASCYPWSVLWRATDTSGHVQATSAAHKPCPGDSAGSPPQGRRRTDRPGYGASSGDTLAQGCHPQSVRSQVPFAHGLKGAGRSAVDPSAKIMPTL